MSDEICARSLRDFARKRAASVAACSSAASVAAGPDATPPTKRPRQVRSSAATPSTSGSMPSSCEAVETQIVESGKTCAGCRRAYRLDLSYTSSGDFPWMYADGKGHFCRDCGNLFRIALKASMTVAMYDRWIREETNQIKWSRWLVAYLTLKREGAMHVSFASLSARVQSLAFAFDLCGLPFGTCVVELQMGTEFMQELATTRDAQVFLARTTNDQVVGLRLAPPSCHSAMAAGSKARYVTQAQAQRAWPIDPWRKLPSGFRPLWDEHIGEAHSCRAVEVAQNQEDPTTPVAKVEVPRQKKAFADKVANLEESATLLIATFVAQADGSGSTEKEFTGVLTKVLRLKQDVLQSSAADLVTRLSKLAGDINAAKRIIKPSKDFFKTGRRLHLEGDGVAEACEATYNFVEGAKMKIGDGFASMLVMAVYFQKQKVSFDAACDFLGSFAFPPSACKRTMEDPLSGASVVQHCVGITILDRLQSPKASGMRDDEWDNAKAEQLKIAVRFEELASALVEKLPLMSMLIPIAWAPLGGASGVRRATIMSALALDNSCFGNRFGQESFRPHGFLGGRSPSEALCKPMLGCNWRIACCVLCYVAELSLGRRPLCFFVGSHSLGYPNLGGCACPCVRDSPDALPSKAYVTLVKGALHDHSIAPKDVEGALNLLQTNPLAVHIKEGLAAPRTVGGGIRCDAEAIWSKGLLDEENDQEFRLVLEALFSQGMPSVASEENEEGNQNDDGEAMHFDVVLLESEAGCECSLSKIATQSLDSLSGLLRSWSPRRISEEIVAIRGALGQVGCCIAAYDFGQMHKCASQWSSSLALWDAEVPMHDEWPPKSLKDASHPELLTPEACESPLPAAVLNLQATIQTVASFSAELQEAAESLTKVQDMWVANRRMRKLMWTECSAMLRALGSPKKAPSEMLADFLADEAGLVSFAVEIAEVRRELKDFKRARYAWKFSFSGDPDKATSDSFNNEFWDRFENGVAFKFIAHDFVMPMMDFAGDLLVKKLSATHGADFNLPASAWADESIKATSVFERMMGGTRKYAAVVESMQALADDNVADAAQEEPVRTVADLVGGLQSSVAGKNLGRIFAAVFQDNIHIRGIVKEGCEASVASIRLATKAMTFVEATLMLCAYLAHFADRLAESNSKSEAAHARRFALVVAIMAHVRERVAEWASLQASFVNAGAGVFQCSVSDLEAAMKSIGLFVARLAEDLKATLGVETRSGGEHGGKVEAKIGAGSATRIHLGHSGPHCK